MGGGGGGASEGTPSPSCKRKTVMYRPPVLGWLCRLQFCKLCDTTGSHDPRGSLLQRMQRCWYPRASAWTVITYSISRWTNCMAKIIDRLCAPAFTSRLNRSYSTRCTCRWAAFIRLQSFRQKGRAPHGTRGTSRFALGPLRVWRTRCLPGVSLGLGAVSAGGPFVRCTGAYPMGTSPRDARFCKATPGSSHSSKHSSHHGAEFLAESSP